MRAARTRTFLALGAGARVLPRLWRVKWPRLASFGERNGAARIGNLLRGRHRYARRLAKLPPPDDQATLALSLVPSHGRATPLLWLRVLKDELKDQHNAFEDLCLARLAEVLPEGAAVTILADRGFGDTKLFDFLDGLGFGYVIRFRGNIHVSAADGETRPAAAWAGKGGRARKPRDAGVTAARCKVGAVVCVKAKDLKEAWCLAASNAEATAREIMNHYARRWTIEPGFRDTKNLRFGMGLSVLRIADPQRRDRLLLLNAFAIVLLTLLGAAGESLGMDRHLKVNTAKHRTHSLFRQGCMLY